MNKSDRYKISLKLTSVYQLRADKMASLASSTRVIAQRPVMASAPRSTRRSARYVARRNLHPTML